MTLVASEGRKNAINIDDLNEAKIKEFVNNYNKIVAKTNNDLDFFHYIANFGLTARDEESKDKS